MLPISNMQRILAKQHLIERLHASLSIRYLCLLFLVLQCPSRSECWFNSSSSSQECRSSSRCLERCRTCSLSARRSHLSCSR
ncbi:hypothetical protein FB567DRAFT_522133 [Paraphoma chrysanthemicola]|uniref:Uncharacterized protein n=1 Tax=Paraphoma chrysanthemicola TaxID=798071 RepID=A0A8K0R7K2_9PLEO|nr:hypothetical protein FB567DRAFT_522133 [Paraphoma chrysanthemicola]